MNTALTIILLVGIALTIAANIYFTSISNITIGDIKVSTGKTRWEIRKLNAEGDKRGRTRCPIATGVSFYWADPVNFEFGEHAHGDAFYRVSFSEIADRALRQMPPEDAYRIAQTAFEALCRKEGADPRLQEKKFVLLKPLRRTEAFMTCNYV